MKSLPTFTFILILISVINTSSKAQKNLKETIPKEAFFVGSVQLDKLEKDISWQKIMSYNFIEPTIESFGQIAGIENSAQITEIILKPENSGISHLETAYFFGEIYQGKRHLTLVFKIYDVIKFKSSLNKIFELEFDNKIMPKAEYLTFNKNGTAVAWQKDHAFITTVLKDRDNLVEDTEVLNSQQNVLSDDYLNKICNLNISESYSTVQKFNEWEKSLKEAGIWTNYKQIVKNIFDSNFNASYLRSGMVPKPLLKNISELLVNISGEISIASDITFEKGGILSNTSFLTENDIIDLSKSSTSNKANKKILKYIDGERCAVYMITVTSPKGVYEGWKKMLAEKAGAYKSTVDNFFGILEIFIDEKDAFNFLRGDVFFAINGLITKDIRKKDFIYNSEKNEYEEVEEIVKSQIPSFSFGFSYGKKEDILKFIRIIQSSGFLKKENNNLYRLYIPFSNESILLKLDKGLFVISNDEGRLLENRKYKSLSKNHKEYLKSDFQTVYINPKAITGIMKPFEPLKDSQKFLDNFSSGVKDIFLHFKRPIKSDSNIRQEIIFDLNNKEENALKQILDFINSVYLEQFKGI